LIHGILWNARFTGCAIDKLFSESAMVNTLNIKFHNIPASEAVEAEIRKRAEKLYQLTDRINRCDVTVETNGKHKQQGHLYEVRIDLTIPGAEIALNRVHPNEDVYIAVRDTFDAASRKLKEHIQVQRGEVKVHEAPPVE
jgi:ribosomal subunit interface protein